MDGWIDEWTDRPADGYIQNLVASLTFTAATLIQAPTISHLDHSNMVARMILLQRKAE